MQFKESGSMVAHLDTLPKLLYRNSEVLGDSRAFRKKNFGIWQIGTWKDYYENVKYFSLGLISLGLEAGDRVAIIGDNDPQWYWAELATQSARGVPVGIFQDCALPEVKYIVDNCGAKYVIARDQEQVDKLLSLREELPDVHTVIYWDDKGLWLYDDPQLKSFERVQDLGREYERSHPGIFEENVSGGHGEDIAFLAYTSGTTGMPKGAPITHHAFLSYADHWSFFYPPGTIQHTLSSIPPAWFPEQCLGITIPIVVGSVIHFAEAAETVDADRREVAPNLFGGPPRTWETVARHIQSSIIDAGLINRIIYHLFLPIGHKFADLNYERKKPDLFWKTLYKIADLTTFRPLKDKLGLLRVRCSLQAGGFLGPATIRFFHALGLELKQLYALTEGGMICYHREHDIKYETVGQPVRDVNLRISDEGEVLIKSDMVFSGYYMADEAAQSKLRHGWLYTGDAGFFDDDGQFIISDRVDALMELAQGKKFSPSFIESRLRLSPYIKEVLALGGNDKPYVTCIVDIDFDNVSRWAEMRKIPYTTLVDLSQKPQVYQLIKDDVVKLNRNLPAEAKVRRFVNLHKEFDADEADITRTRKVRRTYMEARYASFVDALYGDIPEIMLEAEVKYRDGRTGKITTIIKVNTVIDEG